MKEGEDSADVRVCKRLISSAAVKSAKLFLEENQLKRALGRGDTDHPPLAVQPLETSAGRVGWLMEAEAAAHKPEQPAQGRVFWRI